MTSSDASTGGEAVLANPRGFCAGVDRAIQIVERALEVHGAPVYVLHEIVHNQHVLERLRGLGARFVPSLDEVPEGSVTVFSAHGVSDAVVAPAASQVTRLSPWQAVVSGAQAKQVGAPRVAPSAQP